MKGSCAKCGQHWLWQLGDGRRECRRCGHRQSFRSVWDAARLSEATKRRLLEYFVLGVPAYRLRFRSPVSPEATERFFRLCRRVLAVAEECQQLRFPKGNIGASLEEIRRVLERENIIPKYTSPSGNIFPAHSCRPRFNRKVERADNVAGRRGLKARRLQSLRSGGRREVGEDKGSAKTVLVAEGLSDTRMFMRMALERHGYRVVEASTGEEAVEVARGEVPDLILLDLHLQGPAGLEAARRIREEAGLGGVPIVATSTSESPELEAEALAAGCDMFRRQPIDFEKFGEIADLLLRPRARGGE